MKTTPIQQCVSMLLDHIQFDNVNTREHVRNVLKELSGDFERSINDAYKAGFKEGFLDKHSVPRYHEYYKSKYGNNQY